MNRLVEREYVCKNTIRTPEAYWGFVTRIYEWESESSSAFLEEDSFSLHVEEELVPLSFCGALDVAQSSAFSFFFFPKTKYKIRIKEAAEKRRAKMDVH